MRRSALLMKNIILMGAPGGGKGTISKMILKDFNAIKHISTGDLIREQINDESSSIGKKVKDVVNSGGLVSDDLVLDVLKHSLNGQNDNLLFDGFPRSSIQAQKLTELLNIDLVIHLNIPHQVIIDRLSSRWIHAPSGRVYAYDFNPPKVHGKDDETGEPLTQREDDKPETVATRLKQYDDSISDLLQFYSEKGVLHSFSGEFSKIIYKDVKILLEKHF